MRSVIARSVGVSVALLVLLCASAVPGLSDCERYRIGAVCSDGWRSSATGSGACSHHGGVDHWVYSEPSTPVVNAGPDKALTPSVTSVLLDTTVSGGTKPYTYLWSPGGQRAEDITVNAPGTYTLTVTGADGCSASDNVVVTQSRATPTVQAQPVVSTLPVLTLAAIVAVCAIILILVAVAL